MPAFLSLQGNIHQLLISNTRCWQHSASPVRRQLLFPCHALKENQYFCFVWGLLTLKAVFLRFPCSSVFFQQFMSVHHQKTPTFLLPILKLILKKFSLVGVEVTILIDKRAQVLGSSGSAFVSVMPLLFTLGKDLTQWIFAFVSCVWVIYWVYFFFLSFQVLLNNYRSVVHNQGSKVDELETEFINLNHDVNALQEKVTYRINLKIHISWLHISILYPDIFNLISFFLLLGWNELQSSWDTI